MALAVAVAAVVAAVVLRWARVWWQPAYVALGLVCWLAAYNSGVHPTLAGVAFGLLAPARPRAPREVAQQWAADLSDEPSADEMRQMTIIANETVSEAERLQHLLHPVDELRRRADLRPGQRRRAAHGRGARRPATPARWRSGWPSA